MLSLSALLSPALSQDKLVIELDKPSHIKMPIVIPDFIASEPSSVSGRDLASVIRNDLTMTGLFQVVEPQSGLPVGDKPDFESWSATGAQVAIIGRFQSRGNDMQIDLRCYDVALKRLEVGKKYTGQISDHRRMVHMFGDRVMEKLTGTPGCFTTKIAFVAEGGAKEIYSMDYDGFNTYQVTNNRSINMSPEWEPNGKGLIFTSYMHRNPDLWLMNLASLQSIPISARPGINASGRYSPDGGLIALSLSFKGSPNIFIINTQGQIINRLTEGRGNDISPSWAPDGGQIAYVSDQAGTPQIYIRPSGGGRAKRLTLNGNYNTDPDWAPKGDLIAFTSRIEGKFQVCTMKTDGSDLKVLTNQGSNQDPAWSPDGRMLTFVSNRDGKKRIYIMDSRGQLQVPVSRIAGKAPAWSRHSR